jgi:hypothetical protein
MLVAGEWMDAVVCFTTGSGDPTLTLIVPTMMYSVILLGLYIVGESPVIPVVISIIMAGVIFTAFPTNATSIVLIVIIFVLAIGGFLLTNRFGS